MSGPIALISKRRWLIAVGWAALVHLLVIALLIWAPAAPTTSAETPRGVMVSLDDFDTTPPPPSIEDMPIQELTANNPQAVNPATAAPSAPPAANDGSAANAPIEAASSVGPTITNAPTDQSAPAAAVEASPPEAISAAAPASTVPETAEAGPPGTAASPTIVAALSVTADQTLSDRLPSEQVTARNALPPSDTNPNGAYGNSDQATNEYVAKLRGWLARHKHYPDKARSKHVEGTVKLLIAINAGGKLLESRIVESSGSPALDAAARQMLTASQPLPPMPVGMRRNRLELIFPIVFTLQ